MLLKNKTAIITGSNRGIGLQILKSFHKNGASVFACSRTMDKDFLNHVENFNKNNENKIIPISLNLQDEKSIKDASEKILSSGKSLDIMVNNAGDIHTGLFQMTKISRMKEIFDINFFSQALFTQNILKSMVKKKSGSIIFISSTSGLDSNYGRSAYSASKNSIISLCKTLSKEVGNFNIRVNNIAPGLTETDMMRKNTPENFIEETLKNTNLKKIGKTEDVANAALFFASDLSSHITGQTLRVDGGMYGG